MKVNFYATLRPIVGRKTIEVALPDQAQLRDLIERVVTRFPPLRDELLDERGELLGHVHVFVNGRDAHHLRDILETPIASSDKIDIFPAIGGG